MLEGLQEKPKRRAPWVVPRWKKGQSGNPAGRPKGTKMIPELLREIGERPVDPILLAKLHAKYGPNHNPRNMREAMLMAAHADAGLGDEHARVFIAERTEGKVTDKLQVEDVGVDKDNVGTTDTSKLLAVAEQIAASVGKVVRTVSRIKP